MTFILFFVPSRNEILNSYFPTQKIHWLQVWFMTTTMQLGDNEAVSSCDHLVQIKVVPEQVLSARFATFKFSTYLGTGISRTMD